MARKTRKGWQHGTAGGYVNHGCRCTRCKAAHSALHLQMRARRWAFTRENGGPPPGTKHGRSCYFNWGCKCDVCLSARRRGDQEARARG